MLYLINVGKRRITGVTLSKPAWGVNMKKRILAAVMIFILLIPFINTKASADSAPKPSVVVKIKELENENYYVTLLSEKESTGPWSSSKDYYPVYGSREIWEKFNSYSDSDGYYFVGYFSDCSKNDTFRCTSTRRAGSKSSSTFPSTTALS